MNIYLFTPYRKLTYVKGCIAVIANDFEQAQQLVTEDWKKGYAVQPHEIPVLYPGHKQIPGNTLSIRRELYEGGKAKWNVPEYAWGLEASYPVQEKVPRILFVSLMEK